MNEIKLVIEQDSSGDVTLKNSLSGRNYIVTYREKKIGAKDLFESLDYKVDNLYVIEQVANNIVDVNKKTFFDELFEVITKIISATNEINNNKETQIENSVEEDSL